MNPVQADWIMTWSTAFSAVGTVGALLVGMRLLSHERIARRAQDEADSRRTAELVSCWWRGVQRLDPTEADEARGAVTAFSITAVASNLSREPIYDVVVSMTPTSSSDLEPADLQLMEPESRVEVLLLHRRHPQPDYDPDHGPIFGIPSIAFTDGRGRRWKRGHDGQLHNEPLLLQDYYARRRASEARQDLWFATWAENPYARTPPSREP